MNDIQYLNENLLPGILGHSFLIIGFVTALLTAVSYFIAIKKPQTGWERIGKVSFSIHGFAVISAIGTLLFMLANNLFEYHYVWQHSNSEMPMRYIFSAFWEGQEGSTLLWLFWQAVIGLILLRTAKKWEAPVMMTIGLAQALFLTMVLGIYVLDAKIGSSPFTLLLREHPDFALMPIFSNPDYLAVLDGRGLNPLLQNYWMTIHPPTLFFGFALTLVPFAYAMAGLVTRQYKAWIEPALTWTFLGIAVLGTGILMGGAWAYESLTFGGFWAWDPVENASLVPWITLVAGAHLMLIQRAKTSSLTLTFSMVLITFFLILYSTFLTKSGILGDSSVHSFTDLGLSGQLVLYLIVFGGVSIWLIASRYKEIPKSKGEDATLSREFWMFVGSLVLFIAAFQIIFTTSNPVWNKIFGLNLAPKSVEFYNQWQLPFAIVIGFLVGATQWMNYRKTDSKKYFSALLRDLIISLVLTIGGGLALDMKNPLFLLMFFSSSFAVVANFSYAMKLMKIPTAKFGSSIAHIGFGLILLGALVSNGMKDTISHSTSYDLTALDTVYKNNENVLLMLEDTAQMGDFMVTFAGKEKQGIYVYYNVDYLNEKKEKQFTLKPFIQLNERMGNVAEPSTKHYFNKDIFTYVTYAEIEDREEEKDSWEDPETHQMQIGDTIFASNAFIILNKIQGVPDTAFKTSLGLDHQDLLVQADLTVYDIKTSRHDVTAHFAAKGLSPITFPTEISSAGLKISFVGINPDNEMMSFEVAEAKNKSKEFIIMQAIVFPWINILWLGCIVMAIGTLLAVYNRIQMNRK